MPIDASMIDILVTLLGLWVGGIEWRLRAMNEALRAVPSRQEVKEIVDDKQEAIRAMQVDMREDIKEIKQRVEKVLDALSKLD